MSKYQSLEDALDEKVNVFIDGLSKNEILRAFGWYIHDKLAARIIDGRIMVRRK